MSASSHGNSEKPGGLSTGRLNSLDWQRGLKNLLSDYKREELGDHYAKIPGIAKRYSAGLP